MFGRGAGKKGRGWKATRWIQYKESWTSHSEGWTPKQTPVEPFHIVAKSQKQLSCRSRLHFWLLMIQIIPNPFSDDQVWNLGWSVRCCENISSFFVWSVVFILYCLFDSHSSDSWHRVLIVDRPVDVFSQRCIPDQYNTWESSQIRFSCTLILILCSGVYGTVCGCS